MFGIDISNHQTNIDLTKGQFDFAIVKATEGKNFIDPSFGKFVDQLTKMDKPIGVYCYARPDNQMLACEMQKSANFFLNTVANAGLLGKAILILDWEQNPIDKIDLLQIWAARVKYITGITPFIYASSSFIRQNDNILSKLGYPLWVAAWPYTWKYKEFPDGSFIKEAPHDIPWKIWQFTSNGAWPGYNGRVDFDYTDMTKEEWDRAAFGARDEILPDDFKWAVNAGLFHGYPDGSYRPSEPLTRAQLATVLRRYDKLRNKGVTK